MSQSYADQFPIQKFPINPQSMQLTAVVVLILIEFLIIHYLIDRKRIHNFLLRLHSAVQSQLMKFDDSNDHYEGMEDMDIEPSRKGDERDDQVVMSGGEIGIVLRSLGMCCNSIVSFETDEDLSRLFEDESPSLDEIRAAFDVFDDNRDGFIDAKELQKVLSNLGLKEGSDIDNCRRMIRAFDEDGDGKIDFCEFVRFMECSSS